MTAPEPASQPWGNTLRIRAELLLDGGRTLIGDLHLLSQASTHSGPETPADALNRDEDFIPLIDDTERTILVAKHHVLTVGIVAGLPADDPDRRSAARTLGFRVELSDGSELTGTVISELPPDRSRALDFLNLAPRFFGMSAEGVVHFVNRSHIRTATPLD